ncbi:MAG: alkaline phosphatase family protein [Planctomycetota bacterium]|nr:alkaline phosphatase family protein [Planctomycetota bacterium]
MVAYIGPGSGFAISVSLLTFVIIVFTIMLGPVVFPLTMLWRVVRRRRVRYAYGFRKVVVLGLDGLDPKLTAKLMGEGKLPNFQALAKRGHFSELETVWPALTPAAWSTFMTGLDPSRHGIYDFITRDTETYLPRLSSSEVLEAGRMLRFGRYRIPLGRGRARMLRKGEPFWHELARHRLEVTVLRVPITFPPERFGGRVLSGMCVPDLRGSQGTFGYYATLDDRTDPVDADYFPLRFVGDVARTQVVGPEHPFVEGKKLTVPLAVKRFEGLEKVALEVGGQEIGLSVGQQSEWVALSFRAGPMKVRGLAQFHLKSIRPEVLLYMTPLHIDPEAPAMPVSHPGLFSNYLAKKSGTFGTLGLIEDTTALNCGVLDEDAFLRQAWGVYRERKAMFLGTLENGADDVTICVFDTPDRIQHMFWRQQEEGGGGEGRHRGVVEAMLVEMDGLVGETLKRLSDDTLLMVMSDHGFTSFRRTVDLNAWLHQNGYLHLKEGAAPGAAWLEGVDWSRTRAYAVGLVGIFVNLVGRESKGIVPAGEEFELLVEELKAALEKMMDTPPTGSGPRRTIRRAIITSRHYDGPYRFEGPDIIVGYEAGYRCSWECARGQVSDTILKDNSRLWSGDHCVDPELVPGVLLCNAPLESKRPRILDIAPTVLGVFGLGRSPPMQGSCLLGQVVGRAEEGVSASEDAPHARLHTL